MGGHAHDDHGANSRGPAHPEGEAHGDHRHGHGEPGHEHDVSGHGHDHAAELRALSSRRLLWALILTSSFLFVEVAAGLYSGSLALLSDAGHMLTDAGALGLALFAQALASRARTGRRTFGYRRAEILAALINGTVLGVSAIWVVIEAVRRFREPPAVHGGAMFVVATLGLMVNLASAWVLSRGGLTQNVNVRAAFAHVLSDAAGSVAAMIAAGLVVWRGWTVADPVASVAISVLILIGAYRLVRASVDILMEGAPADLDVTRVDAVIRETPGVAASHDLHVWSISDGFPSVTVHVVLAPGHHGTEVASAVAGRLQALLGVAHVTVQPEAPRPGGALVPAHTLARRLPGRER